MCVLYPLLSRRTDLFRTDVSHGPSVRVWADGGVTSAVCVREARGEFSRETGCFKYHHFVSACLPHPLFCFSIFITPPDFAAACVKIPLNSLT